MSSNDIVFDKSFDLPAGQVEEVAPGVRRLLCDNPGPFTWKGTVSYILGRGNVAIVDPGPDDPRHVQALLDAVRGETVTHILVTHTHRDHSPGAAAVTAAPGAPTLAEGPHRAARALNLGEVPRMEAANDLDFRPDQILADGDTVEAGGFVVEAITTPGHTANHMAFALRDTGILLSGDHVMAWATSVVAPPDGAMSDYMASLHKLATRDETIYLPGHGGAVRDARSFVVEYIRHREGREASILGRLRKGAADIPTLVRAIYIGLDPRLAGAAGLSVMAHLVDLVARGVVATEGAPSVAGTYRLEV
jgi:glyoxylase-like metal-dependent hydrolase (beta-lactamase superfamily II)